MSYPKNIPFCPKCEVQSGLNQCVVCGRDYELKDRRDAQRAKHEEIKRVAALIPLRLSWPEDDLVCVYGYLESGPTITLLKVKLSQTGSKVWKNTFEKIKSFKKEGYTGTAQIIRDIKQRRYQYRTKRKKCSDFASEDIQIWAHTIIAMQKLSCVDNIRYARLSHRAAMRCYNKRKRDGCCGSFDIIKRCPFDWMRRYTIGCNYGH